MIEFDFKELSPEDVLEEWQEWFNSDHTQEYTRSGRKIKIAELKDSIERGKKQGNLLTFGIRDVQKDQIFGTAKLGPIDHFHGLADFAIFIGDKNYLGKGLSSRLIELGCAMAFEKYEVRKLHSGILERNTASLKAYTRAGWIAEGVLRSHYKNNGVYQDWIMISKYDPRFYSGEEFNTHAIDLAKYLKK
jgi:RimJ/RimL family protein N-acetyltransferase